MVKAKKQDPSKLWKIVNSAFFLWFLSTIIIGTGTFLFKKWDNERTVLLSNQENIKKLDLEISSRLLYFYEQLLAGEPKKTVILVLENPTKSEFPPGVFPQYNNRPLRALLWELQSFVPESEKREIKIALSAANDFKKIYLATKKYPNIFDSILPKKSEDKIPKEQIGKMSSTKINTNGVEVALPEVAVDEELDDYFTELETDGHATQEKPIQFPKKDLLEKPEETTIENEKNVIRIAPMHITLDLNIKISQDEATEIIAFTFTSFNLKRWGYPFKDFKIKTELKNMEIKRIK